MSTSQSTVDFFLEQIADAGIVSARKMFGEYCVYCNGKVVALICDDQLFVKPTSAGNKFLVDPQMSPPYDGAKPWFFLPGDRWDDREWLSKLVSLTAQELSTKEPKSKSKRSSKPRPRG